MGKAIQEWTILKSVKTPFKKLKFFKGCLLQILIRLILNTLTHIFLSIKLVHSLNAFFGNRDVSR